MSRKHVVVMGGGGRVGRHVVDLLSRAGHTAVSASRSNGVDAFTGEGLGHALAGADCVIDTSSTPSADEETAVEYFSTVAENLQHSAATAEVAHIVAVSIINVDRFTTGYNAGKVAHEKRLLAGKVPVTIVRAAQFHEFVPLLVQWGTQGDVAYIQKMRTQLVAARTVAEALVAQATSDDPVITIAGNPDTFPQIAGPRDEYLPDIAESYVAAHSIPVTITAVSDPVDAKLYESGALLPGPEVTLAGPTFSEWLADQSTSGIRQG